MKLVLKLSRCIDFETYRDDWATFEANSKEDFLTEINCALLDSEKRRTEILNEYHKLSELNTKTADKQSYRSLSQVEKENWDKRIKQCQNLWTEMGIVKFQNRCFDSSFFFSRSSDSEDYGQKKWYLTLINDHDVKTLDEWFDLMKGDNI